jgi:hypothetical protein
MPQPGRGGSGGFSSACWCPCCCRCHPSCRPSGCCPCCRPLGCCLGCMLGSLPKVDCWGSRRSRRGSSSSKGRRPPDNASRPFSTTCQSLSRPAGGQRRGGVCVGVCGGGGGGGGMLALIAFLTGSSAARSVERLLPAVRGVGTAPCECSSAGGRADFRPPEKCRERKACDMHQGRRKKSRSYAEPRRPCIVIAGGRKRCDTEQKRALVPPPHPTHPALPHPSGSPWNALVARSVGSSTHQPRPLFQKCSPSGSSYGRSVPSSLWLAASSRQPPAG